MSLYPHVLVETGGGGAGKEVHVYHLPKYVMARLIVMMVVMRMKKYVLAGYVTMVRDVGIVMCV